jgi:hypothetical protein
VGVKLSVTPAQLDEKNARLEQVHKIVDSHVLHGSESLCKLLQYLAHHATHHPGVSIKEYQIATEVFGRPPDFDPHLDATIRVQAGRLRSKLAEYYASEGSEDQILVELPKGSYVLSFHDRPHGVGRTYGSLVHESPVETASKGQAARKWFIAALVLSVVLAAVVAVATDRFLTRKTSQPASDTPNVPVVYSVFWKGFLTGPEEPWVIFSNAPFVGRPDAGMRYYDSKRDSRARVLDYYTGVGEVLAVHALDKVFAQLRQGIRVKRGSLFSLDDAKHNDLIFIGSPIENLTLLEIPSTENFVFQSITSGVSEGAMEIINVHPQPGEPKEYVATPPTESLAEDYSVVALKRGLDPAHSVLILAGTTTIGTQAAVEYVCQKGPLEELLRQLSVSRPEELKPFEAVIRVRVARGVPVGTELVSLRRD